MTILVVAEHDQAALKGVTLNTVAAAQKIGGDIHVVVAGHNAASVAQAAAQVHGVAKVLHADAPQFANQTAENVAALIVATSASICAAVGGLGSRLVGPPSATA